ncbi:hypothetical protein SEA_BIG4_325 [Microbacterium phage Big4]|nr:hypothetical protein SEA_BIG4_325 [Microbacterium phage Big4]
MSARKRLHRVARELVPGIRTRDEYDLYLKAAWGAIDSVGSTGYFEGQIAQRELDRRDRSW